MHTVIEPYCTGCELCIPVCPVDCISLENVANERTGWAAWSSAQAAIALDRYIIHSARRNIYMGQSAKTLENTGEAASEQQPSAADAALQKRAVIDAALARARSLREKQN